MAQSFRALIGAPPSTASINDSALLIIDAQNEYATGQLKTVNVDRTRAAIASLLTKYRDPANRLAGKNIVHVLHRTPDGAPVFTPNTPLAEEFEELKPRNQEHTLHKTQPSAFAGTGLEEYLNGLEGGVGKKIVLVGYMAHVCVSTTARVGAEKGFEVVVVEEAVGDRDVPGVGGEELTRVAVAEVGDAFGTVLKGVDQVEVR